MATTIITTGRCPGPELFPFFTGFGQPRPTPISDNSYVKPFDYELRWLPVLSGDGGMKNSGDVYEKKLGVRLSLGTR